MDSRKSRTKLKTAPKSNDPNRVTSSIELVKMAELFHIAVGDLLEEERFDEDPLVALHRIAPGLEKEPKTQNEIYRCVQLCKEGIF
jgi:hypothetical protein